MSYDIRICVKVEGVDKYADIARPKYDSPTYNLGEMFRACMDWDFSQSKYYRCNEIIHNVERGIRELRTHRSEYEKYNPPNGWGTLDGAIEVLESLQTCIYEEAEYVPIEHLCMRW